MIRIFVDTSIARFSEKRKQTKWATVEKQIKWGPKVHTLEIQESSTINPRERLDGTKHEKLLNDLRFIPKIKQLAKDKLILLFWHLETNLENSWFRPICFTLDRSFTSLILRANDPLFYGRTVASAFSKEDEQLKFLKHISHPKFEEWKGAIGWVRDSRKEKNQLMDAWNLWTAEHNHCEYFLTMDYKFISSIASRKFKHKLRICPPGQLVKELKILLPALKKEKKAWAKITSNDGTIATEEGSMKR